MSYYNYPLIPYRHIIRILNWSRRDHHPEKLYQFHSLWLPLVIIVIRPRLAYNKYRLAPKASNFLGILTGYWLCNTPLIISNFKVIHPTCINLQLPSQTRTSTKVHRMRFGMHLVPTRCERPTPWSYSPTILRKINNNMSFNKPLLLLSS